MAQGKKFSAEIREKALALLASGKSVPEVAPADPDAPNANGVGASDVEIGALEKYIKFQTPAVISYDKVAEKLVVGLSCESKKGVEVTEWGLCYGDSQTLSVKGSKIVDPDMKDKKITAEFNDVAPGSSLYVRAYVYDGDVLAYGSTVQVHAYDVPTVEIGEVFEITAEGASVAACVADDCGLDIIERGIVYVKGDKEPDKSTGKSVVSGTVGDYVATLTG